MEVACSDNPGQKQSLSLYRGLTIFFNYTADLEYTLELQWLDHLGTMKICSRQG